MYYSLVFVSNNLVHLMTNEIKTLYDWQLQKGGMPQTVIFTILPIIMERKAKITNQIQGSRWALPMSPFAIFNFIWRQNTALGDFFGDNILFIKNYFVLLSISGAGKKHRLLERASRWQIIKTGNKSITSDC